ncbi:MAG: hypothetical protein ABI702_14015 [Burkholderiales bacterium]
MRSTPVLRQACSPRSRLVAIALAAVLVSCGGGGDGGAPLTPPGPPVTGPAWWGFGRDTQHSAIGAVATQDLNRIAWSTPLDLAPQRQASGALLIHYGSPVVTTSNTVIVPVKTGATGGFRFEARSGTNGVLIWSATSDYVLPAHNWTPSYNLALTRTNRLYAPEAGGKLLMRDDADAASGTVQNLVFYGAAAYAVEPSTYDARIFINTPLTIDSTGNVYFGFIATGATTAGLTSGVARIGADSVGSWVGASAAAADPSISKVATNSAPALSNDEKTLYVAVNAAPVAGTVQAGALLALDSATLAVKSRAVLNDPAAGKRARISDDGTASPTVGPDGDVFFGVLESVFGSHNARGWLLHFDATLATLKTPGSFGWDDTASIVPAAMVPSYTGSSSYLLATKYNNYEGVGTGDGQNRVAVLDPNAMQTDPISGRAVLKEVLSILGPTFESGSAGPVKEWCINTAAVDPLTHSVLVNSEDGYLYRWDLRTNTFTQRIQLTSGIAESYTPTAIGADGAVYAVNNAVLFSIGR